MSNFTFNQIPKKYRHMVKEITDERDAGDGIWVYLNKGFLWDNEVNVVHEQTPEAVIEAFSNVNKTLKQ